MTLPFVVFLVMFHEFSQLPQVVHGEGNNFLALSDGHRHEPIEVLQPIYLLEITSSIFCPDLSFFTARKRSLRRLCFHRCLSVHREGVCHTPSGQTPPGQTHSLGRHPPPADTPGQSLPCPVHAGIQLTSGRCASHWNAFL